MAGVGAASAQTRVPNAFDESPARLTLQPGVRIDPQARFGGEIDIASTFRPSESGGGLVAAVAVLPRLHLLLRGFGVGVVGL